LAVVTPTLDGDVLAVLALADATFTTGQLERMLPKGSDDGIRKVLARLRQQGVVLAERAGNTYLYRLNREHLAAGPIVEMARMRSTLLDRLGTHLAGWEWPPVYGAVFGSMARGTAEPDSGVDLLLVRPDDAPEATWEAQLAGLSSAVTRWTGNDARPVAFSPTELKRRRKEPLFHDVLDQGLTVAGDREWFRRQLGAK
jgi:hypothetical protein